MAMIFTSALLLATVCTGSGKHYVSTSNYCTWKSNDDDIDDNIPPRCSSSGCEKRDGTIIDCTESPQNFGSCDTYYDCYCLWGNPDVLTSCICHDVYSCHLFAASTDEQQISNCVYFHVEIPLTYRDAQIYCQTNFGTDLATVHYDELFEHAKKFIDDGTVWIGLRSTKKIGWFEWENGRRCNNGYGSCVGKKYWVEKKPRCVIDDNGKLEEDKKYIGDGYSCVTFSSDGTIDNCVSCNTKRTFLCNSGNNIFAKPSSFLLKGEQ